MPRSVRHALTPLVSLALLAAPSAAFAHQASGHDPCVRTRTLHPGPTDGPYYSTIAPFEHFGSDRTQVFPRSCTLKELTGQVHPSIRARSSADDFAAPYTAVTRNRNQLYLYGYGADAASQGGYVARVNPASLHVVWRTRILDPKPAGQWSYPGVLLSHGNGFLYAIYGNVLAKLAPTTGRTLARRELPEDPNGTGAAYNGMVVLPNGRIVAKKIERGPCPASTAGPSPSATVGAFTGLLCAVRNRLPSEIVVVDPKHLKVLSTVASPEPVTGRITWGRTEGRDYVYAAGADDLFRFRYHRGALKLDRGWGPVPYRTGNQKPGTGPGLLGRFVVVQTNSCPRAIQ